MDLNNDGYRDILSGSYSRMEQPMAGFFQVLWGEPGGKFKEAAVLNGTDQQPLIIAKKGSNTEYICTRPVASDWNGDGKLDLVTGNFAGSFYLFVGEGPGRFAPKAEPLMTGTNRLTLENAAHSDPFVVDWDGDGDMDLVSGASPGGVQWSENTAGRGKAPALKKFVTLIKPGPKFETGQLINEPDLTGPAKATRIWVDDVNGDGKLDVLVGDSVTLVSIAKGVSKKEYAQKLEKWKQAFNAASKAQDEAGDDQEKRDALRRRFTELYQQRAEFMHEEMTGYVWLYRRK